jgi:SAM-dependent methyltransferase
MSIWDDIYARGEQLNRWPWDQCVSFVFRNAPKCKPRAETRILEVGCGTASNLWFAAREGWQVAGIDFAPEAIAHAERRFRDEGLTGDFRVGLLSDLPWTDQAFDLVIDRGGITCVGSEEGRAAIAEARRVLVPGGRIFFNPKSARDSSAIPANLGPDGLTRIAGGHLAGYGLLRFYHGPEIRRLFAEAEGWKLLSLDHVTEEHQDGSVHAEWRAVAERRD